jgi:asparagine synthase (glutamine-hydrolysing)
MCGICGSYGIEDTALLKDMMELLHHRGPDDSGFYSDKNLLLGHRRLKIIDLSERGRQPILNEDSSMALVANGEIYNFREIRRSLEEKGHSFSSDTDIEVILHSYEEYGEDCVGMLNGMFAFAIWDSGKRQLLLARDRHGIKPIYYALVDGDFLFASELKSLLIHKEVKREIDYESFNQFINLRYIPRERTMFKHVRKLEPGHMITFSEHGLGASREYWRPKLETSEGSIEHYASLLRKTLREAVKRHLVSDVPLGVYLSGGIDSSTILALASEFADEPVRTFTMGFGEDTDEVNDAENIARHFDADHRSIILKAEILKDYPKMIWHMDCPKRNLYTYYLSQFIGNHVKVVLSGLGADELFGGYTWKYVTANVVLNTRKKLQNEQTRNRIIEGASALFEYQSRLGLIEDDRFLEFIKRLHFMDRNVDIYLMSQSLDEVFSDDYLSQKIYSKQLMKKVGASYDSISKVFEPYFNNDYHFIDQILLADYSVKMKDDFLFVEDGMSMANSIESRVPFLDNDVVDLSFKIPFKHKIYNIMDAERGAHIGKYVLRRAMKDTLPEEVFRKVKQGFGTDVFKTYTSEIKEFASSLLPNGHIVKDGLINGDYVRRVLNHYDSRNLLKHYCLIWSLVTMEIWYQMYVKDGDIRHPKLSVNSYLG